MMTFDEVMRRALQEFPDAELGRDNEGQLVIYTGLYPSGGSVTCTVYGKRCDSRVPERDSVQGSYYSCPEEYDNEPVQRD